MLVERAGLVFILACAGCAQGTVSDDTTAVLRAAVAYFGDSVQSAKRIGFSPVINEGTNGSTARHPTIGSPSSEDKELWPASSQKRTHRFDAIQLPASIDAIMSIST